MPVWPALCDLGAPGWGEPWFPHSAMLPFLTCLSYGDLFVLFLVLLFSFLAIRIHLMMRKSLSANRGGRLIASCRLWFFVCLVCLVFVVCFVCLLWFFVCLFLFFFRHVTP